MLENLNENIDAMLFQIYDSEHSFKNVAYFREFDSENIMDYYKAKNIAEIMVEKGLIRASGKDGAYKLTERGVNLAKNGKGSYLEFVRAKKVLDEKDRLKEEKREAIEKLSADKLIHDYKLSKWQTITFWPVVAFGLAGGIYATIDFIRTPSFEKDVKVLEQTIEEMEAELSNQRALILAQRNLDSLRNPKTSTDSLTRP